MQWPVKAETAIIIDMIILEIIIVTRVIGRGILNAYSRHFVQVKNLRCIFFFLKKECKRSAHYIEVLYNVIEELHHCGKQIYAIPLQRFINRNN